MVEKSERTLILTPLATVKSRKQEFLDAECVVPMGTLTLFAGRGGEGKTTLALDYAARITQGTLEGDYRGRPRRVLIISHEDDPGTQLKPKLIAAGCDLENVFLVSVQVTWNDGVTAKDIPSLLHDLNVIRQAVEETDPVLIVFDPLTSSIEGDGNKVGDVRRSLQPLMGLLHEYNLACIGIAHVNKGAGSNAGDRVSGSHAYRDAARSLLLFATDQDSGERICTQNKSSYSPNGTGSFKFRLVSTEVMTDDGRNTTVARVEHLGSSTVSVDDLWARERDPEESGRRGAKEWLLEHVESVGGSALQRDIVAAGKAEGYGIRMLQVACSRLGLQVTGGGPGNPYRWTLPQADTKDEMDAIDAELDESVTSIATIATNTGNEVPL